jgi:hypothetical protein
LAITQGGCLVIPPPPPPNYTNVIPFYKSNSIFEIADMSESLF